MQPSVALSLIDSRARCWPSTGLPSQRFCDDIADFGRLHQVFADPSPNHPTGMSRLPSGHGRVRDLKNPIHAQEDSGALPNR
jgi:hypothetical protein